MSHRETNSMRQMSRRKTNSMRQTKEKEIRREVKYERSKRDNNR